MEGKDAIEIENPNDANDELASQYMSFFSIARQLKMTKRAGWVESGISDGESVADHSWSAALAALVLPIPPGCDRNRCVQMALVHDLAESIVGDITPLSNISKQDKLIMEMNAIKNITKMLPKPEGDRIYELWDEYSNSLTPNSKYVHGVDKLDMMLETATYEKKYMLNLESFFSRLSFDDIIPSRIFQKILLERSRNPE